MKNVMTDEHLAFHADRVLIMAWICTLADKMRGLAQKGNEAHEIGSVCNEIVAAGNDMISELSTDAAACGISINQIREFTILVAKSLTHEQRERLLVTCECQA